MRYKGNGVSEGYAIGKVFRYQPIQPEITKNIIKDEDIDENLNSYNDICKKSKEKLNKIIESLKQEDEDKSKIFEAHINILEDEVLIEDIKTCIKVQKYRVDWAIHTTFETYIQLIGKSGNALIRERAADLLDVRNRLINEWFHVDNCSLDNLQEPLILLAHDLLPSDTARLDRKNVLAIINEIGGNTSHTAILARGFGIPAILGVEDAMSIFSEKELLIVDAFKGEIIRNPSEKHILEYKKKINEHNSYIEIMKDYLNKPALTKDEIKIEIGLNIGGLDQELEKQEQYVDTIGLFRTEFLYMNSKELPSEQEQYGVYKKVLEVYGDKPVILRTMDIGGDKTVPCLYMEKEDNPFLGNRALRLCFKHVEIFKTQLRAALRASVFGNLWIMFPMVSSVDDIYKAKAILEEVKNELIAKDISFSHNIKVGIMIETPSMVLMADKILNMIDFASIGTNDLCQYLTAVDRTNPSVSSYYQSYHPSLFIAIKDLAYKFNKANKPLSICGEIAGDPLVAPVLVGLGIRKLSMSFSSLAKVKKTISEKTLEEMKADALSVLSMDTSCEIEEYLKKSIK